MAKRGSNNQPPKTDKKTPSLLDDPLVPLEQRCFSDEEIREIVAPVDAYNATATATSPPRKPVLLDFTVAQIVLEALGEGMFKKHAAALVGINPTTLQGWIREGRRGGPDHHLWRFAIATHRVQAKRIRQSLRRIKRAGFMDWRAELAWLERTHPADYGVFSRSDAEKRRDKAERDEQLEQLDAQTSGWTDEDAHDRLDRQRKAKRRHFKGA